MMKRRAIEGAYLLAFLEKDTDSSFEEMVNMIIRVTDTKKEGFMQAYQYSLDFLSKKVEWYKLKSSLRNVLADFIKLSESEKNTFAEEYFKQIESEYFQIKFRNENYLLEGKKFARIYNIELNENNKVKLHMSIVTNNIMKYDKIMFDENKKDNHYKPYFVEFISDYFDLDYLKKLGLDNIDCENDQWIEIQFLEDKSKKDNGEYISGTFIFSASPLKIGKRTVEITGDNIPEDVKNFNRLCLKKVKNYILDTQKNSSNNQLEEIFPKSYTECEITIFNVGQGSLNLIEVDNKKFLFDIGDSEYNGEAIERKNKEKADKLIKAINPYCVILSHWDLDHILGIAKMTDEIFDAYWIVPDITEKNGFSDSARRLICFLAWYSKTKLVSIRSKGDDMNNTIIFSNDVFELGKGTGKTYYSKMSPYLCDKINSLNFQNNFGLVLKVKGRKEHTIFAGDCEYKAFPENFMTQYPDYLVAPHHGSKMDFDIKINNSKVKLAFISAGKNNYKCKHSTSCNSHPNICHIRFLEELGYSVYQTALTSYYTFKL